MVSQNFSLYKGQTLSHLLTGSASVDGYTLTGQARPYYGYTGSLVIGLGVSGSGNDVTVSLSDSETTSMPSMKWVYEVEGVSGDNVTKFFYGRMTVEPEVYL